MATLISKYSKTLKKDIYYVVYYHTEIDKKTGRKKQCHKWQKIGSSKTRAEDALREFESEQKKSRSQFDTIKDSTLKEFVEDHYLPWSKSSKPAGEYVHTARSMGRFLEFSGKASLQDIDERLIERYKAWRKSHCFQSSYQKDAVANATVNRDIKYIKQCFIKAVKWGFLDKTKIDDVKLLPEPKGRVRFFSLEETSLLFEYSNPYVQRFLLWGINTGMRMSEILNTRISDIDLNKNLIHIVNRKGFRTKSLKDRSVPMPPQLRQVIQDYIANWIDFNDMSIHPRTLAQRNYLFCKQDGTKILSFKKAFERLLERTNITDASIHTMRHTYASHLVMVGIGLGTVRDLLGHADIRTTMIYAHLSPEHLQNAVQLLHFPTHLKIEAPNSLKSTDNS